MILKITEQNGILTAEGSINSFTSGSFQNQLNIIMNIYKKISINNNKISQFKIRLEFLDQLNFNKDQNKDKTKLSQINISDFNRRREINGTHFSNSETSYHSNHVDLINNDDDVII